jgi:predicted MFS family arabinose efflux permease
VKNRSALAILFIIVLIDLLGFGMVIPQMPRYAETLLAGGGSEADAKKWIGALMAAYSLMQFVFAPVWGRLSDRLGRRPMLLASIAMTAVAFAAYAVAPTFGWLLASRFFAGAATANIPIARAYVADVTAPEDRARGMGIIGAAFGLGFVLGPFFGGILGAYSQSAPGYAAAALAAANGIAAFFILPEPANRVIAERRRSVSALVEELQRPGIRRLIIVYFLVTLAFSAMEATFALYTERVFAFDERRTGFVFAYIGVIVVIVQGGLIGRLTRRYGERRLLIAGVGLQVVGLALLPVVSTVAGLLVALVPLSVGSGLTHPALTSLLSQFARRDDQGGTLGIGESASALARVAGPIGGTWSLEKMGLAYPYLGGAALMAAAAAFSIMVHAAEPDTQEA